MVLDDLKELHYITPIDNMKSIAVNGIVSHQKAEKIPHQSVAMNEIQERRRKVVVPGGRPLHQYVNLYFHALNPMMFKRKDFHAELCIVIVNKGILNLPRVVITDGNASSCDCQKLLESFAAGYSSLVEGMISLVKKPMSGLTFQHDKNILVV